MQLAVVVDKGSLVGEVHPDRRRQDLNFLLGTAEHAFDLLRRPVLVGTRDIEEDLGIFRGILHAHAAMALGARLVREHVLVRRIVLIHHEPVEEVEADASERVVAAGRHCDLHLAAGVADVQAHARKRARVARLCRQIFIMHDGGRHVPDRIDSDRIHRLAQERGGLSRLTDHNPGSPDPSPFVHHLEREVRQIDQHMRLAQVTRIPAPAFHVGDDGFDLTIMGGSVKLPNRSQIQVARRGQAVRSLEFFDRFRELGVVAQIGSLALEPKPLAQLRHARVLHLMLAAVGENRALRHLFSGGA